MKDKTLCKQPYCKKKRGNKRVFCDKHHLQNQKERNPISYTFNALRSNARRRGKDFTLTLEYFTNWCAETGYMETKGKTKTAMTIDRDDQTKGYVPGNLKIMSNDENRKKYVKYYQEMKRTSEDDIHVGNPEEEDPF